MMAIAPFTTTRQSNLAYDLAAERSVADSGSA
jgi:hypothetical protein